MIATVYWWKLGDSLAKHPSTALWDQPDHSRTQDDQFEPRTLQDDHSPHLQSQVLCIRCVTVPVEGLHRQLSAQLAVHTIVLMACP